MAEIDSSSAATNPVSPFYGNLFQRIQFHGIVLNQTKDDLLPFDACCPSLQTKLSSRLCSICKQYIPISIRLRNHYRIHRTEIDYDQNKEENILDDDDDDLNDPYEISSATLNSTQKGVCLFSDIKEWLKSDFEDDVIVDTKSKSTVATTASGQTLTQGTTIMIIAPDTQSDNGTVSQQSWDDLEDLVETI